MKAYKILIADDEERMRRIVADFLRNDGFIPLEAKNGREAVRLFEENTDIALIILDVMMPDYDGWAVCREIRSKSRVPIIMLTARGEEADELFGFDLGADEYITKPFSLKILIARVQALLRRTENADNIMIEVGGLIIDDKAHRVMIGSQPLDLSPREYDLLLYLVRNIGIALSREQILAAVWEYNYFGDGRAVDTHIKNLRAKLGFRGTYIQTVRGMGYRFEVSA